eukprot:3494261-Alexandrium_andersonii.AAC.1
MPVVQKAGDERSLVELLEARGQPFARCPCLTLLLTITLRAKELDDHPRHIFPRAPRRRCSII